MAIPRFNAQINEISVPTMKDFEYEQNRSIYETMKRAGEQISNTFFKLVSNDGKKKNKDEGIQYQEYEKSMGIDIG